MALRLSDLLFVDVEASGLHKTSYPIEVGWAAVDAAAVAYLVLPPSAWGEDDWSPEAEKIHDIPRSSLDEGLSPFLVAAAMDEARLGRVLVSDAPERDAGWLALLYIAAGSDTVPQVLGLEAVVRSLADARGLPPSAVEAMVAYLQEGLPHVHRAAPDAAIMRDFVLECGFMAGDVIER